MAEVLIAEQLRKSFLDRGKTIEAVCRVDLHVEQGELFGFLGPNGAGKTTTLRMLTTLLAIDGGRAIVAGLDVGQDPVGVRRRIGYVGQSGGADLPATGRENLLLQGRLYELDSAAASLRAEELIEVLALGEFVDRPARTYSGGQRRRLEVALGLMHNPRLLFLDEPTTGLDPQNRANLWQQLRELRDGRTTVFLTTHYLDEADALADRIAIIDRGRIVAEGSPSALKREVAYETAIIKPRPGGRPVADLAAALRELTFVHEAHVDGDTLRLSIHDGTQTLPTLLERLRERGVELEALSLSEPSLDDVFLGKTGRALRDATAQAAA